MNTQIESIKEDPAIANAAQVPRRDGRRKPHVEIQSSNLIQAKELPIYLTLKEVAELLKVKPRTIYAWVSDRKIPYERSEKGRHRVQRVLKGARTKAQALKAEAKLRTQIFEKKFGLAGEPSQVRQLCVSESANGRATGRDQVGFREVSEGCKDQRSSLSRLASATRMGDAGADAFTLAAIFGWSDIRMAMRYTTAMEDAKRRAVESIAQNPSLG